METIAKIRRLSVGQGKSIKQICRELKVSRKVVRKVLRSGQTMRRGDRDSLAAFDLALFERYCRQLPQGSLDLLEQSPAEFAYMVHWVALASGTNHVDGPAFSMAASG
ncbi:hypothetical protein NKJ09_28375 [Mesorhizobium sp. M0189]